MNDCNEIYQRLLEEGYSEEQLLNEIKKKEKSFQGFITKAGALFMIAKESGLNILSPDIDAKIYEDVAQEIDYNDFRCEISYIKEGMSNIVLLGIISRMFPIHTFSRKDGTIGKVGSFILKDLSGSIKIILWDKDTDIMNSSFFHSKQILQVVGGYAKMGTNDQLEVHIGKKGRLIINPKDIPKILKRKLQTINLEKSHNKCHLKNTSLSELQDCEGFIKELSGDLKIESFKEIDKKTGEKTFLLRLLLYDESDSILVNIWDLKAIETLKVIQNDIKYKLMNVIVKLNPYTNLKEVNFTKETSIQPLKGSI